MCGEILGSYLELLSMNPSSCTKPKARALKDHRNYDISLAILQEEVEHEAWFQELLKGRPSGHFKRRPPGEGPYTQKFRHVE
jgi:hypothetical protein